MASFLKAVLAAFKPPAPKPAPAKPQTVAAAPPPKPPERAPVTAKIETPPPPDPGRLAADHVSGQGLALIQAWEGIADGDPSTAHLEPYICPAGVYTVGWGHALTLPGGKLIRRGMKNAKALAEAAMLREFGKSAISVEEAEAVLRNDIARFERCVRTNCAGATQGQFDAMVALCFNIGEANFASSTVKRMHNLGQRAVPPFKPMDLCERSKAQKGASNMAQAFCAWSYSNKVWMLGLFRRRMSEALLYRGEDVNRALQVARAFRD